MTYYILKFDKEWKRYKLNMWLVLEMTHVQYFSYILSLTNLKIMKLVWLKTKLNKLSRKKKSLKTEVIYQSYGKNKLGYL